MRNIKILLWIILSFSTINIVFAENNSHPLFPEDGSQSINKWYYSDKEVPFLYDQGQWEEVLNAFKSENITPINTMKGEFFQDIGFFDKKGNHIVQHLPIDYLNDEESYSNYFSGFTQEVYRRHDYGQRSTVNLLQAGDLSQFNIKSRVLKDSFIEGGASISGTFKNGDDYLIVNHSTYIGIKYYFKDRFKSEITKKEVEAIIEKDFNLKPGNLIVLLGTSHIHLDTLMKALPGGVILLDAPKEKVALLEALYKRTKNHKLLNYLNTTIESQIHISFNQKAISKIKKQLENRFKIHQIPGFFSRYIPENGSSWKKMDINFFNGVSGTNKSGDKFFITNRASDTPELQDFWAKKLEQFGFTSSHIHFVGRYKGNAGLDCMGSPSP